MCSRTRLNARPMISNWPGTGNNTLPLRHRRSRELPQLFRRGSYTPPPSLRPQPRTGHPEPQDMSQERPIESNLLFCGTLLVAAAILFTLFIDILISLIELLQPL